MVVKSKLGTKELGKSANLFSFSNEEEE